MALYLDSFTNNSSVVLAIELVESRKVLLFAAAAQTGNWLSWSSVKWERKGVDTDELLARTVFYKVGHHASHNATLVDVLEWKMPARNLFKRLVEKTDHRVLQMDGVNPTSCDPNKEPAKTAWKRLGTKPKTTDLYIELEIR